ncbi:DUF1972 domain-containing protein [Gammaproteobacteria bacterium]|nr:DUF1972 domain-containing protein [Gammaproteobacteria bacterium]
MKLAIIGSVGVPASYGGFETLVEYLIDSDDHDFTVYCSKQHYSKHPETYKGTKLIYIGLPANGPLSIVYDIFSILHAIFTGQRNLLILGVSGAIIFPIIRLFAPFITIVTNIDGIEWRREKWGGVARRLLKIFEYLAVKCSHTIVSDNDAISSYVKREYGVKSKTIAYGGEHAVDVLPSDETVNSLNLNYSFGLAVCRIERENNCHTILDGFSNSSKNIIFIGNWHASAYGRALKIKYAAFPNIRMLDPEYDIQKLYLYRKSCQFYIHGHSAGGTNPSLVEIMHFSKQIIAFDCNFNRETLEGLGSYFSDSHQLVKIINEMKDSLDLSVKEVATRRYTWEIVRQQYFSLFME